MSVGSWVGIIGMVVVAAGCGGDKGTNPDPSGVPASIAVHAGSGQAAAAGSAAGSPILSAGICCPDATSAAHDRGNGSSRTSHVPPTSSSVAASVSEKPCRAS